MNQTVTLASGVQGLYIPSARFKTTRISVSFFLPLERETISANTLLPAMLTTSSAARRSAPPPARWGTRRF